MYLLVKHLHLSFVAISVLFLVVRYFWLWSDSPQLQKKWVKVIPHIVDTGLLVSALVLCVVVGQYPLIDLWITEKLFAVVLYILCAAAAFRIRVKAIQLVAMGTSLLWLLIIAKLAVLKQPMLFG